MRKTIAQVTEQYEARISTLETNNRHLVDENKRLREQVITFSHINIKLSGALQVANRMVNIAIDPQLPPPNRVVSKDPNA